MKTKILRILGFPTLNSDSNCATLTVLYVEEERSQKAKPTASMLGDMAHKVI